MCSGGTSKRVCVGLTQECAGNGRAGLQMVDEEEDEEEEEYGWVLVTRPLNLSLMH